MAERDKSVTAGRYFPNRAVSAVSHGVNHIAPLHEVLQRQGWIEIDRREPYMYQGRQTAAVEYERGRSYLMMTTYKEDGAVWVFVKIRGFGDDVIQIRDWMTEYESNYGRIRA